MEGPSSLHPSKTCRTCKACFPADHFGTRRYGGKVVEKTNCARCALRHATNQRRLRKTPKGRESHLLSLSKYRKTQGFAEAVARYQESDKHAEKVRRKNAAEMADPSKKLMKFMVNKLSDSLSGRRTDYSATLQRELQFATADEAMQHFVAQFPTGSGWTPNNYGSAWVVDHKIPRKWYDHSNAVDRRRCWSAANLGPLDPVQNNKKRIEIPPTEQLLLIGKEHWPLSWQGVPPTAEQRRVWYAQHHDLRMGRV